MKQAFTIFVLNIIYSVCISQAELPNVQYNKSITSLLDSILVDDQKYRMQLEEVEKKFGSSSEELKAYLEIIQKKDATNLIKVKSILDKFGWLGPDIIGKNGNETLFLVIQHSDQNTQEKYLPMMREAVKNGKAQGSALALLEDRVALGQGKKQIYGSQISGYYGKYKFSPIEDEINVNKRRASVGLEPIEEYAKNFGFVYKMEDPNITDGNIFFRKYSIVLSLLIVVLIFSVILFSLYKFKLFAWFWLLLLFFALQLIMLPLDYYSAHSIVANFKGNAILFLFIRILWYCMIIFTITFITFKLFKFKHMFFDLISIFVAAYVYAKLLNDLMLQLFLSDSGLIFMFTVLEPSLYSGIYLIISFILLRISYKRRKKELTESLNEDKLV